MSNKQPIEKKEKEKTNVTVSAKVTKNTKSTRGTRNINKKQNQDIFKKSNLTLQFSKKFPY